MVRLTKIYTRGGDAGKTSLSNGKRVKKNDLRIEAIGAVDETNAAIGLARLHADKSADAMLKRIQNDLFDLGADLAAPPGNTYKFRPLRITQAQIDRLEREIDKMNAGLKPLDSFVLPGGTPCGAHLHLARTMARRAERAICTLAAKQKIGPTVLPFINRLSDHLFVLSRHVNNRGKDDVLWVPGQNTDD